MSGPANARLRRGVAVLALLGAGALATRLAQASWASVITYVPPYHFADGDDDPAPALCDRVVIVLVDGLRLDASREMPFLNRLRAEGADFDATAAAPSYSRPGRAAVATGAWSEIHGATTNFHDRAITVDNLFRAARRAGRSCAVAGSLWKSLFGPDLEGSVVREPPVKDEPRLYAERAPGLRDYGGASVAFVAADTSGLDVMDLLVTDYAAHEFGARSSEYREAALWTDRMIQDLVSRLDLARTTVVVTSDHGHLDKGGHGGPEPEVVAIPLVLAGKGVRRGFRATARQVDVAPTVAALLGLPLPGAAQGRILLDALDASGDETVALLEREWRQKAAFARADLAGIGVPAAELGLDLGAEPSGDASALNRAIARLEARLAAVRRAREAADRRSRVPFLLGAVLAPLPLLAWLGGRASRPALVAAGTAVVVYGLAFRFLIYGRGIRLALSAINHEEDVEPYFVRIGALAALAVAVALVLAFAVACRAGLAAEAGPLADLGLGIVTLLLYLLGVVVAAGHWRHGLFMVWHRADFGEGFGTFVSLVQMQAVGAGAALVPALAWLSARAAGRSAPARAATG